MRKFFRNHPQTVLSALAIVLSAFVIVSYVWGIGDIIAAMQGAVSSVNVSSQSAGFNLGGASRLDLRGIVK